MFIMRLPWGGLGSNYSSCPSNVLYLLISVIPYVINYYLLIKFCHGLQGLKSAFVLDSSENLYKMRLGKLWGSRELKF